jgi:hypothetical protein
LFGVTALSVAQQTLAGWGHLSIAVASLVLAVRTKIHPVWILLGGALLGKALGIHSAATRAG